MFLQAARVAQAVPTVLNIPAPTLQRRMRLAAAALEAWAIDPEELMPSVFGRLMTASDARIARLRYISFLHTRQAPTVPRATAADPRSRAVAVAAAAVARAAAAIAAAKAVPVRPGRQRHGDSGKARVSRVRAFRNVSFSRKRSGEDERAGGSHGGVGAGSGPADGRCGPPGKKPITILNMTDAEFKEMYPRFERWYRRQSRTSSVVVQQM